MAVINYPELVADGIENFIEGTEQNDIITIKGDVSAFNDGYNIIEAYSGNDAIRIEGSVESQFGSNSIYSFGNSEIRITGGITAGESGNNDFSQLLDGNGPGRYLLEVGGTILADQGSNFFGLGTPERADFNTISMSALSAVNEGSNDFNIGAGETTFTVAGDVYSGDRGYNNIYVMGDGERTFEIGGNLTAIDGGTNVFSLDDSPEATNLFTIAGSLIGESSTEYLSNNEIYLFGRDNRMEIEGDIHSSDAHTLINFISGNDGTRNVLTIGGGLSNLTSGDEISRVNINMTGQENQLRIAEDIRTVGGETALMIQGEEGASQTVIDIGGALHTEQNGQFSLAVYGNDFSVIDASLGGGVFTDTGYSTLSFTAGTIDFVSGGGIKGVNDASNTVSLSGQEEARATINGDISSLGGSTYVSAMGQLVSVTVGSLLTEGESSGVYINASGEQASEIIVNGHITSHDGSIDVNASGENSYLEVNGGVYVDSWGSVSLRAYELVINGGDEYALKAVDETYNMIMVVAGAKVVGDILAENGGVNELHSYQNSLISLEGQVQQGALNINVSADYDVLRLNASSHEEFADYYQGWLVDLQAQQAVNDMGVETLRVDMADASSEGIGSLAWLEQLVSEHNASHEEQIAVELNIDAAGEQLALSDLFASSTANMFSGFDLSGESGNTLNIDGSFSDNGMLGDFLRVLGDEADSVQLSNDWALAESGFVDETGLTYTRYTNNSDELLIQAGISVV